MVSNLAGRKICPIRVAQPNRDYSVAMTEPEPTAQPDPRDVFQHEPEARPSYAEAVAFCGHLAYRVAPLREALAHHLVQTQGEMLPHMLMDDVLAWLLSQVGNGITADGRNALDVLDEGYRIGSDALRSLMVVSLLEALPGFDGEPNDAGGRGHALRIALGPTLSIVLAELEQHRGRGGLPRG